MSIKLIAINVDVCSCTDGKPMAFATLSYTEIELNAISNENPKVSIMVGKVLSFIHNMQKMVEDTPSSELKTTKMSGPSLKWTGGVANLVELVYGLVEMGCVNDGDVIRAVWPGSNPIFAYIY